jgi:hypothetical protein
LVSLFLTKTHMHVATLMQKWLAWAPSIWTIWERNVSLVFQSANDDDDDDNHFLIFLIIIVHEKCVKIQRVIRYRQPKENI